MRNILALFFICFSIVSMQAEPKELKQKSVDVISVVDNDVGNIDVYGTQQIQLVVDIVTLERTSESHVATEPYPPDIRVSKRLQYLKKDQVDNNFATYIENYKSIVANKRELYVLHRKLLN